MSKGKTFHFIFELRQLVYYMFENQVASAPILMRTVTQELQGPEGINSTVRYKTIHGEYRSEQLFATKEELVHFLMGY